MIEAIGAVTAPIWTAANVKTFNTNIVTLVGNAFVDNFVHGTVGYVFSEGASWKGLGESLKGTFVAKNGQAGETFAKVLGNVAAIYNLGNATVANKAGDVKLFKSTPSAKYTFKDADGNVVGSIW
ncbi:MAG: hypothetical protein KH269_11145 [Faecalibacterium prausnitzii]|nr:hypothetical protein [Faecalibacterium prausnitzii]